MKLLTDARSLLAAFRAGAILGNGFRERDRGNFARASQLAEDGLVLLRSPYVVRHRAPEGSALASLTVLAEEVREKSNSTGASRQDLADSIAFLKLAEKHANANLALSAWLPQLEKRLETLRCASEASQETPSK
jgi:hypothetical protein